MHTWPNTPMTGPELLAAMDGLVESAIHPAANLANAAALLYEALPDINWAGFYFLHQGALWLGPFQGKVACTKIAPGKGVCGTALSLDETQLVPDVHLFPGHIACDAASQSEIVIPLRQAGRAIGVLDIDSPSKNRFTADDRSLLEKAAALLEARCDFSAIGYDLKPKGIL